ncbi:hypothetical protein LAZ67_1004915 [Cordylochernes scorpioides]|uniref:Integrase zinc-binding domain-containing protein n=1 Tax=Cordylochernes scorpioides TaxID=51811 RepID=A0ABY6JY20_9ARAC|nr:hypothetical protein LAZ67_1004915 [Cordylochernes scorpioides]
MYSVRRRTKRWPLCLFFNFLDVVAINSAVIYKAVKQDGGMARKDFIKQLALQLMRDALNMRNQAKNLSRDLQVLIQKHAGTSSLEGSAFGMEVWCHQESRFLGKKVVYKPMWEGSHTDRRKIISEDLSTEEITKSEIILMRLIQRESFSGHEDKKLQGFKLIVDSSGILRIKTKICRREDFANFRMPILLPSDHFLVSLLIRWNHETHGHAGLQTLLGILRENYWILRSRKTVKKIINQCIRCKRFTATPATVESTSLPEDRVRDAAVFEIVGVDLTGHLILKNKKKAWIVIFTWSSGSAEQEPGRPSIPSPTGGRISSENGNQKIILKENSKNRVHANPPAGVKDVNLAAARDVTLNLPAGTSSNGAARVLGNWADCIEDLSPGAEDDFNVVKTKNHQIRLQPLHHPPTAETPGAVADCIHRRDRYPRAQEIPTTRTHITEARAKQASSSEEHCAYLEHGPELQPFHYLRALDRLLGGTAGIIQISKVNGHQLLGLANRGLAERLINNGLEVEGTLLRAFPFRKRAERIKVSNLPFFVEDSAIINALRPFGRITSIAPKMMKAGPDTYTDGRREAFIVLHEGMTTERLPTRLDITIKGEAWPAYLSTGIKCSSCHGQGHRRANCPLLAGLANNTRTAPPTTPAGVPPPTTPAPPQRSAAQPPAPAPSGPAMEVCSAPPVARAVLHPSTPRPSPPAAPALSMEETPSAPPPVTPAPSLPTPGSREPAAPTPDVEMSIVEETFASSTSSAKNATRVDLDAFIEGHPSVSFAKTDALGLGREEVLDLLSSRTRAQRKGPLLSPPQCDALVGLIGQILDLRPGAASNLYKVLGQVKAELRTTPAVPPTPTLPAPRPARPTAPAPQVKESTPAMATPPPPPSVCMEDDSEPDYWTDMVDSVDELMRSPGSEPILQTFGACEFVDAARYPEVRECVLAELTPRRGRILAQFLDKLIERTLDSVPLIRRGLSEFRAALPFYDPDPP